LFVAILSRQVTARTIQIVFNGYAIKNSFKLFDLQTSVHQLLRFLNAIGKLVQISSRSVRTAFFFLSKTQVNHCEDVCTIGLVVVETKLQTQTFHSSYAVLLHNFGSKLVSVALFRL